jgi:hypothetical protein
MFNILISSLLIDEDVARIVSAVPKTVLEYCNFAHDHQIPPASNPPPHTVTGMEGGYFLSQFHILSALYN